MLLYHTAAEEIENLSNDSVDFPMFRVQAQKIKNKLSEAANKTKQSLMESTAKWCSDTVTHIQDTYYEMKHKINTVPVNERELVIIKEFIKVSKEVTQVQLTEMLKDVTKHHELLDEFSFMYEI